MCALPRSAVLAHWTQALMISKRYAFSYSNSQRGNTNRSVIGRDPSTTRHASKKPRKKGHLQWSGLVYHSGHIWKAPDSRSKVITTRRAGLWIFCWFIWKSCTIALTIIRTQNLMFWSEPASKYKMHTHLREPQLTGKINPIWTTHYQYSW